MFAQVLKRKGRKEEEEEASARERRYHIRMVARTYPPPSSRVFNMKRAGGKENERIG